MTSDHTTVVVQRYLDALANNEPADPIIRDLLGRTVNRLRLLTSALLHHGYPRLTQPPLNLESDDLLGAVVERLLKALREARPSTARQFFALATQHMRWELNDLARRLDTQPRLVELGESAVRLLESSGSGLSPTAIRIMAAIEALPDEEREVLSLVRIQGMSHEEAGNLLGVSVKTIQRRLHRGLLALAEQLPDLRPAGEHTSAG